VRKAVGSIPGNVHVESFIQNLPGKIRTAKLYVGMSGYNSMMAVMAARKRCVLLPRGSTGADEQWVWAELMRRLGFASAVFSGPRYSVADISSTIRTALSSQSAMRPLPEINMTGAEGAVYELLAGAQ